MEGEYKYLFEIFQWGNRDHVYLVRFTDGDEYEITDAFAGQDIDEPPHAVVSVLRVIQSKTSTNLQSGDCIFFYLSEIAQVIEPKTGETLFQTV